MKNGTEKPVARRTVTAKEAAEGAVRPSLPTPESAKESEMEPAVRLRDIPQGRLEELRRAAAAIVDDERELGRLAEEIALSERMKDMLVTRLQVRRSETKRLEEMAAKDAAVDDGKPNLLLVEYGVFVECLKPISPDAARALGAQAAMDRMVRQRSD